DVQIFDRDGRDNSILYKFAHSGRQKAIAAAGFSRFERSSNFRSEFFQHYRPISADRKASLDACGSIAWAGDGFGRVPAGQFESISGGRPKSGTSGGLDRNERHHPIAQTLGTRQHPREQTGYGRR
ncbi:hypothetical protein, partial [Rhodanobacter terrae]